MTSKEAVEKFTLKFLLLREWKWMLGIIVTSILWMIGTWTYARNTMAQVWVNTPKIEKLEQKSIEFEKHILISDERYKNIEHLLDRIYKKIDND